MNQRGTTVPFSSDSGLSSVNGVAKFSSAGIVFELESKLFGLISNGVKEVRLPLSEILDIKFRKGLFKRGAKIEIRTKTLIKLAELPNSEGKMSLKLTPDDHERAREAVEQLQKDLAHRTESLPPAHTPVSVLFDPGEDETDELTNR
ncbi:hypothetical protein BH20ACI2_BH20ACI2_01720 [soil metagenome]